MKKIILFLSVFLCLYASAQKPVKKSVTTSSNNNSQLLWYKGKKVNDSTLITTKGTVITYAKKRGEIAVKLSAKEDKMMIGVKKELQMTEQRKTQIYDVMALRKSNVMLYPHINTILKEQDDIYDGYNMLLKNTITLPIDDDNLFMNHMGATLPDSITGLAQQIVKLKLEAEKLGLMYQPPPAIDISNCFPCDSILQKKNDEDRKSYLEMFYGKEAEVGRKTLQLSRRIALLLNQKPYFPGSPQFKALQVIQAKISETQQWVLSRLQKKVFLLAEKYGKDVSRIPLVIAAIITYNRQVQLMSAENSPVFDELLKMLMDNLQEVDKYLEDQMDKKNYGIVLSGTSLVISIERLKQMLGIESENFTENIKKIQEKINAFNRFKVKMDVDYKASFVDGSCENAKDFAKAVMQKDFYVSLGVVDCKYSLTIAEQHLQEYPNYHSARDVTLDLKIIQGTKNVCGESENTAGYQLHPYLPLVKISFCENDQPDTISILALHRSIHGEEEGTSTIYLFAGSDGNIKITSDVKDAMNEMRQINRLVEEYQEKEHIQKLTLSEMNNMHTITARKEYLSRLLLQAADPLNQHFFLFNAKNEDGNLIDADILMAGEAADFKIETKIKFKVTHDPLPYKK